MIISSSVRVATLRMAIVRSLTPVCARLDGRARGVMSVSPTGSVQLQEHAMSQTSVSVGLECRTMGTATGILSMVSEICLLTSLTINNSF